ncbi:MAG: hypothetical protein RSB29_00755 [Alistipes sp.]
MDKNKICEALYVLPENVIIRHRKSVVVPVLVLLAGAAMLVLNHVFATEMSNNLRSSLMFMGALIAIFGLVMTLVRLFGNSSEPYHRPSKCALQYEELYFDHKLWRDVVESVNSGDVTRLRSMAHSQVPAVAVAMYTTPNGAFAAVQAFEYAELEYRPLSELKVVNS